MKVTFEEVRRILGFGYDYASIQRAVYLAKEDNKDKFSQGVMVRPSNQGVWLITPRNSLLLQ